jgi:hypothetical protein
MADDIVIRLDLHGADAAAFADYWRGLIDSEPITGRISIEPASSSKPAGGFGLLSSDTIIAVSSEVLQHFADGTAEAMGTGFGTWLWLCLKHFQAHRKRKGTTARPIDVKIDGRPTTVDDSQTAPPEEFATLDRPV